MTFENLSGKQFGQYELRELLGLGGMGAVYRGYQRSLKREVAIKVLTPQLAQQPDYITRFNREAETAATLEHRHIVPIYDYGTHQGTAYVVMRLLSGGTLTDRIALHTHQGLSLPSLGEVAQVLGQLAAALDYAHKRGVIHRDIKPSNVMFDDEGSAYLVDFGIAKLLYATASMTGTGMILGTPAYMAPEQWRAEDLTGAADQYALGVMVYALVTGRPPFDAPTPHALMYKHLNEPPPPPNTIRPDVPQSVADAIGHALAKAPEDRYPGVLTFARVFEEATRGHTGEATGFFTQQIIPATDSVTPPPRPHQLSAPAFSAPSGSLSPMDGSATVSRLLRARTLLHGRPAYGLMTLALVVTLVAVAGFILLGGDSSTNARNQAVVLPSDTPFKQGGIALLPAPDTPSATEMHPALVVSSATHTPSHTPTHTLTAAATITFTPSETFDLNATANALVNARLTQIAENWTDTPTPDLEATAEALLIVAMTGTAAAWTDTPTATDTMTATLTHTPTATLTPSPTATRTIRPTNTPTSTPTRTPALRPTNTRVPPSPTPRVPVGCEGFLPPRLSPGERACVSDVEPNNIRPYPGSPDSEIIAQIPPGGVFNVLDGPECVRAMVTVWYYVEYNGTVGWTAEGSKRINTYWLSPLPCPRETYSDDYSYLVPKLDGTVLEITEDGDQLNVRNTPSLNGQKIDTLLWGDRVLWTGRLTHTDNYTWYEVKLYSERTAYIAYTPDWLVARNPAQTTPGIHIGATICITHEGDDTHLRNQPSVINSREIQTLYEGNALTVIGGPTYSEYFLWWELRLPDGRTGWAVDVPTWWVVQ